METSQGINDLSRVYLGSGLIELPFLSEIGEKLTAIQEIYDKVQLGFRLKSVVEANDVRIFYFLEDISLSYMNLEQNLFKLTLSFDE
jgi:hypothetical protein